MDRNIKYLLNETESNIQFIASGQGNIRRSEAEPNIIFSFRPLLFCTGAMNWMLDEVKSNKCFIISKKSVRINQLVVWKRLVSTKVTSP